MPGYSAQEIVAVEDWQSWPDLDLVDIEDEVELDLADLESLDAPEAA